MVRRRDSGMDMANAGLTIGRTMMGIGKMVKDDEYDKKYQEYGLARMEGKDVDRDAEDYNFKADMKSSIDIAKKLQLNEKFQADRAERLNKEYTINQKKLDASRAYAEQLEKSGDIKAANLELHKNAYSTFNDGREFVKLKEAEKGEMTGDATRPDAGANIGIFKGPDGKEYEAPLMPYKQAKAQADAYSQNFRKINDEMGKKRTESTFNILEKQIEKPDYFIDEKGNVAQRFSYPDHDGTYKNSFVDPKNGKALWGFDMKSKKMISEPEGGYKPIDVVEAEAKIKASAGKAETADLRREKLGLDIDKAKADKGIKAEADKRKKYKEDLSLMLQPFGADKGNLYDADGEQLTDKSKGALDEAMRLTVKYKNKEDLTPDEKKKLPKALKAVEIYNIVFEDVSSGYLKKDQAAGKSDDWRTYK